MSYKKFFAAIFSLLIIAGACTNDDPIDGMPSDITLNQKSAKIVESDNQFGLELFREINETDTEGKNIMVSPLSVSLALAMAYNGAGGDTKSQMETMLHKLNLTPDEINQSYKNLVAALKSHDVKVALEIANGIFYHQDFSVKNDFLNANITYYDAEVKALDFGNSKNTLETINGWVNKKTHEKIESILDVISPNDVMVLVNAVYFNGEWTYRFEKDNTADRVFFYEDGSNRNIPTMMIKEKFAYYEHSQFEMLELPYGGGKYSMLVFLPKEKTTVDQTIGLLTPENMTSWTGQMQIREKKVFLPKFEFKYDNALSDDLQALGMTDAFLPGKADFKGISDIQIYISEVMHKSYIKVDERGTEAAAVTGIVFENTSTGANDVFAVDRPFAFAIREKDTNAILFIGKVTDPEQE
ncbi:MAG: serpin family protein [Prolixibacteraceae bacterium]|nr:serpin family protein [Prolixibacteraceae bacterium]